MELSILSLLQNKIDSRYQLGERYSAFGGKSMHKFFIGSGDKEDSSLLLVDHEHLEYFYKTIDQFDNNLVHIFKSHWFRKLVQ